jgi:hypothetical protein
MTSRTWFVRLFAAAVLVLGLASGPAKAGLLPVSVTVQPEAGNFSWTYSVVLPTNMSLQAGAYFTIYDFAGYMAGSATVTSPAAGTTAANWTITSSLTGETPAHLNPVDNPGLPNLTFTYNGPTIPTGQLGLGNFTAMSTYSASTTGYFTATNIRAVDGQTDSNITTTLVPTGATSTLTAPEPATLALAGLGLPLIGIARRLRFLKK